jgi:hypothetical protein
MELQDFAPLRLASRLAFSETQGSVLDQRGGIAQAMAKHLGLADVSIHPTAAEVRSQDGRDRYRIGVAQTYVVLGSFDKIEEAIERARRFFEMALARLDDPGVDRLDVHTIDVAPADSFELARDRLGASLLGERAQTLGSAAGVPLSDMSWIAEFGDTSRKVTVQLGPMQSEQLSELLQEQDADFPPNMLFLDVDSDLQIGEHSARDAIESWAKAVETHRAMTTRMGDWLREVLD